MVTLFSPWREGIRIQSLLIRKSENDTKLIKKEKEKKKKMVLNHKLFTYFVTFHHLCFMILNSIKITSYLDLNNLTLTCTFLDTNVLGSFPFQMNPSVIHIKYYKFKCVFSITSFKKI